MSAINLQFRRMWNNMVAPPEEFLAWGWVVITLNLLVCIFDIVYPLCVSACPYYDILPYYLFCTSPKWIPFVYIVIIITLNIIDVDSLSKASNRMSKPCILFWRTKMAALLLYSATIAYALLHFWWHITSLAAGLFFKTHESWGFQAIGIVAVLIVALAGVAAVGAAYGRLCIFVNSAHKTLTVVDDGDRAEISATVELDTVEASRRGSLGEEESIGVERDSQAGDGRKGSLESAFPPRGEGPTPGTAVWWDAERSRDDCRLEKEDEVSGRGALAGTLQESQNDHIIRIESACLVC